ncbi:hypothetical protein KRX19_01440 [Cardiobacteriaceae bacterium TAE3-ERU3]|nr:hypothetical protein [Cardiobacteriaceae bacterium TAE3-ERU3]
MKKQLLLVAMISGIGLANGLAHADEAAERAKDRAMPIPDASIQSQAVTERIATVIDGSGNQAVSSVTEVTVGNSVTGTSETTVVDAQTILPEPRIVDARMDLNQTVKKMRSALSDLDKAESVERMKLPANVLSEYAGQAALLIVSPEKQNSVTDPVQAAADLDALRMSVLELQRTLIANDFAQAKAIVGAIAPAQTGFFGHF